MENALMPILKLTDGEFQVLVAFFVSGTTNCSSPDYERTVRKIQDLKVYTELRKPTVDNVWNALKGVARR